MKKGLALVIAACAIAYVVAPWFMRKNSSHAGAPVRLAQRAGDGSVRVQAEKPVTAGQPEAALSSPQTVKVAQAQAEPRPAAAPAKTCEQWVAEAQQLLKEDKKFEARNAFSEAYKLAPNKEARKPIVEELNKLNAVLIFSTAPSPDAEVYVVKPGDALAKIAKAHGTTYRLIMRINQKARDIIRPGEKLKILKGKPSILVRKGDFKLVLWLDGRFVKEYDVGIGKPGASPTPVGTFVIENPVEKPTWYAPDGVYEFGHPKNILGTRWLGFKDTPQFQGFGIHGSASPEGIPGMVSSGCVRMHNVDVEELYDFVLTGTEVVITD